METSSPPCSPRRHAPLPARPRLPGPGHAPPPRRGGNVLEVRQVAQCARALPLALLPAFRRRCPAVARVSPRVSPPGGIRRPSRAPNAVCCGSLAAGPGRVPALVDGVSARRRCRGRSRPARAGEREEGRELSPAPSDMSRLPGRGLVAAVRGWSGCSGQTPPPLTDHVSPQPCSAAEPHPPLGFR